MDIITAWNALTPERQVDWLKACVVRAARREITDGTTEHFLEYYGVDDLASDAWITLTERLTAEYLDELNTERATTGKGEITLNSLVYRAAADAVRRTHRNDLKNQHDSLTYEDEDGGKYISAAARHSDEVEAIAIGRLILQEFTDSCDQIDRMIIEAVRDGYTGREAAKAAKISPPAITKRLKKLRAALAEAAA